MKVYVNGEPRELRDKATVHEVIAIVAQHERGVAAALHGEVVPRSVWGATELREGDRLEVVQAVQGG